jgi:hypothetical protein
MLAKTIELTSFPMLGAKPGRTNRQRAVRSLYEQNGRVSTISGAGQIDTTRRPPHSWGTVTTMKSATIWAKQHSVLLLLSLALTCVAAAPRAFGDELGYENEVTLRGEVLDLTCYMTDGKKGPGHRACAKLCSKKGLPMGLLTDAGEVYLLIENHDDPDPYDNLKPLAGTEVEVKGVKFSRDGMSSLMVLESKGL